jgi:thiamine-phosphate diphosphorylase
VTGDRPILCLVTSFRTWLASAAGMAGARAAFERFIAEAVEAGIDIVQVREPDLEARDLRDLVRLCVARATGSGTAVVVNDRVDVAMASGAQGVHLKSSGPPAPRVRAGSPGMLIGRSLHAADGPDSLGDVDYAVFGAVFRSSSKAHGHPVAGLGALAAVATWSKVPVLAIGGVVPAVARSCAEAGASGVAAISAFLPPEVSPDGLGPVRAARRFREAWVDPRPAAAERARVK